jgi:hypothetical protein
MSRPKPAREVIEGGRRFADKNMRQMKKIRAYSERNTL